MSDSTPLFSIVIPYRNQPQRLERTLDSIAAAEFDLSRVEVVVVDDASTDGSFRDFRRRAFPFRFQIHQREFRSQSAATNEAIRYATGRYVLATAQDIIFDERMLSEHLEWHERFGGEEIVVLGSLPYARHLDITPFMFYLVNGGFQFAYYLIKDPLNVPPNFLYAPNFSLKRELIERVGAFDERFPFGCQDTDLGIRLIEQGARIVYAREAVGYHNHPVTMKEYRNRQITVGRAKVHLEEKHPDYESAPASWDAVIQQYLMYSEIDLDRDLETVERLETGLASSPGSYQNLWQQAFCNGRTHGYSDAQRDTLQQVDRLFRSYERILGRDWAEGYLTESVSLHGPELAGGRLRARLARFQASIQAWSVARQRLERHGLPAPRDRTRDSLTSRVIHDAGDYRSALALLEKFQDPLAGRCNCEVVLVVPRAACSQAQLRKLREVVDLVVADDVDRGVLEAVDRCSSDLVAVCSSNVEPVHPAAFQLADRLFQRLPNLGVLGGSIAQPHGAGRRYGYRLNGEALVAGADGSSHPNGRDHPLPIEVAIPEFCLVRRDAVRSLLEAEPGESASWNFTICGEALKQKQLVLHLPELEVCRPEWPLP